MNIMNYPAILSILTLLLLSAAAGFGSRMRRRAKSGGEVDKDEFGVRLGATLTLLGLLIGFSFSMAISRYDQRKDYEEEEANAIGTEYLRADLIPDPARNAVQ